MVSQTPDIPPSTLCLEYLASSIVESLTFVRALYFLAPYLSTKRVHGIYDRPMRLCVIYRPFWSVQVPQLEPPSKAAGGKVPINQTRRAKGAALKGLRFLQLLLQGEFSARKRVDLHIHAGRSHVPAAASVAANFICYYACEAALHSLKPAAVGQELHVLWLISTSWCCSNVLIRRYKGAWRRAQPLQQPRPTIVECQTQQELPQSCSASLLCPFRASYTHTKASRVLLCGWHWIGGGTPPHLTAYLDASSPSRVLANNHEFSTLGYPPDKAVPRWRVRPDVATTCSRLTEFES